MTQVAAFFLSSRPHRDDRQRTLCGHFYPKNRLFWSRRGAGGYTHRVNPPRLPCSRFARCKVSTCPLWAESTAHALWAPADGACPRVRLPGGPPRWLEVQRLILAAGVAEPGPWTCPELARARIENGAVIVPRARGLAAELRWVATLRDRDGPPATDAAKNWIAIVRGFFRRDRRELDPEEPGKRADRERLSV